MTQDLFEKYNDLRKSKGMPAFQRWTGTTEALQDAYNKLNGDRPAAPTPAAKKAPKVKPEKTESKPEPKKVEAKPEPKKAEPAPKKAEAKKPEPKKAEAKADSNVVKLSDICDDLKLEPRAARIKLRAAYKKKDNDLPDTVGDTWGWKKGDVSKIKSLLGK
jgi:hypothetical protein